jgi:MerR family Zn(II)-responsive transcriptional regulator of zntA
MLRIGEVAAKAGVSPDTLRYYERMGLLSGIPRSDGGYRLYSEKTIERIQFIRNALRFGFGLAEVDTFLRARESGRAPCKEVRSAAGKILTRVDQQIKELQVARRALRSTLADWDRRLSATANGKPAHLLQTLSARDMPTDCISRRLKNR